MNFAKCSSIARRAAPSRMLLSAREIAHRRVEPDVEVFAGRVGNRDAEIRRVARDVPVGELASRFPVAQPLLDLVQRLRAATSGPVTVRSSSASRNATTGGVGKTEEEMLGGPQFRPYSGQRRTWIDEVGRRVDRAALLAGVGELVRRAALRAGALDVAIRQKHRLDRIVELLDRSWPIR